MKKDIVSKEYEGLFVQFTSEGWFNATTVAKKFNKRPVDWLRRDDVNRFVMRLCAVYKVSAAHFIKTRKGKGVAGTWLHPKLAVKFAQWLDVDFEIWCSEQIDALMRGTINVKKARHQASASFKVMCDMVKLKREEQGKEIKSYHYSNEARLINWALTGQFTKLDRDQLTGEELDVLAMLEERNTLLIAAGVDYSDRKALLQKLIDGLPKAQLAADSAMLRLTKKTP